MLIQELQASLAGLLLDLEAGASEFFFLDPASFTIRKRDENKSYGRLLRPSGGSRHPCGGQAKGRPESFSDSFRHLPRHL
jgi:hypothetical protein